MKLLQRQTPYKYDHVVLFRWKRDAPSSLRKKQNTPPFSQFSSGLFIGLLMGVICGALSGEYHIVNGSYAYRFRFDRSRDAPRANMEQFSAPKQASETVSSSYNTEKIHNDNHRSRFSIPKSLRVVVDEIVTTAVMSLVLGPFLNSGLKHVKLSRVVGVSRRLKLTQMRGLRQNFARWARKLYRKRSNFSSVSDFTRVVDMESPPPKNRDAKK